MTEFLGLGLGAWAVIWVTVSLAALLQSSTGFGMGILSSPVLVLVEPDLVPGVVLAIGLPVMLLVLARERRALVLRPVAWAVAGRLPGAVVGALAVVVLGSRQLALVFVVALLSAVAASIAGLTVARTARNMVAVGFVSGAMGTATSIGGPPMALVYQHDDGPELRSAMGAFMVGGAILSLSLLTVVGEFTWMDLARSAAIVPAAVVGFVASRWTLGVVNPGRSRVAVLGFATLAAVVIGIRSLT